MCRTRQERKNCAAGRPRENCSKFHDRLLH
jgi:hypothetical protein